MTTDLTTCLTCGYILKDEVVVKASERDMETSQFACKIKYKRGQNVGRDCSVDGCTKAAHSRGLCRTHYQQWRRYKYQLKALDSEFNEVISALR